MLADIAAIITIITFLIYILIEWPKIQRRWKDVTPAFEKFLIMGSTITGLSGIALLDLAIFSEGSVIFLYLSGGLALTGISFLMGYWVENKTFVYQTASVMSPIWIYTVAMLFIGVLGILLYWFR